MESFKDQTLSSQSAVPNFEDPPPKQHTVCLQSFSARFSEEAFWDMPGLHGVFQHHRKNELFTTAGK